MATGSSSRACRITPAASRRLRATTVAAIGVAAAALAVGHAQTLAVGTIHVYQRFASPVLVRAGVGCRFTPSCSRYAEAAIARDGVRHGGWRALKRIARCTPWTPAGTRDEP